RDRASKTFGKVSREAETLSGKMSRVGKSMRRTGAKLTTRMTLPIIGAGAAAIKMGKDFETSMLKVKAITGANDKQFKVLEDQARQLGKTTQFSASQAADA